MNALSLALIQNMKKESRVTSLHLEAMVKRENSIDHVMIIVITDEIALQTNQYTKRQDQLAFRLMA